jgi:hypothetical protein
MDKVQEIREELAEVFSGKKIKIWDTIVPLIIFLIVNQLLSLNYALVFSLISGFVFVLYRVLVKEKLSYAMGGLAAVAIAAGIAFLSKSGAGFFVPGLITGIITVLLCFGSVFIKKPIAAWSSRITRRWPKEWYALKNVRPAYSEVTLFWGIAFGLRTLLEMWLLWIEALNAAGAVNIFLGWPYTIAVLIISYFYGIWRLRNLSGPSVEEFRNSTPPPWKGQVRGF